jgi:hypothetical protein
LEGQNEIHGEWQVQTEDELTNVTFQIYLYLVKVDEPTGPRDIMRAVNISSPGVVHRHLQKLADLGWVDKDAYGRYAVKEKVGFKGYVWIGKRLIPRSILFSLFFAGFLVFLVAVLSLHLSFGSPIEESFMVLTFITAIAAVFLLVEALRPRKKVPK